MTRDLDNNKNDAPSPGGETLSTESQLNEAVEHHRAGRLFEAEEIYRGLLAADPEHPHALCLLGAIAQAAGENEQAVDLITKAIAVKPDYTDAHINLGAAFMALGRHDEALASFEQALAIAPNNAEAYNNKGVSLRKLGRISEAIDSYQKAIVINPDYAEAHCNLGKALNETGGPEEAIASYDMAIRIRSDYAEAYNDRGLALQGLERLDDAVASYQKALAASPGLAEAHYNLGNAYKELGRGEDAVANYENAIAINPGFIEAYNNLGNVLNELNRFDDAIAYFRKAIERKPDYADARNNLGGSLKSSGRLDEAVAVYLNLIDHNPDHAEAHYNLGKTLYDLGRFQEAEASYKKALVLKPDFSKARFSLTLLQLLMGDFENGWQGYAQRWHIFDNPVYPRHYGKPVWNGSDPGRHRLLVWGEQGIGDIILGATMIPDLIERGIDVVLEIEPRLVPLLSRSFPEVTCIANDDPSVYELIDEENDFFVPIGDLGRLLRPNLESFPDRRACLVADPDRRALFRKRYQDQGSGPLVGIAWTSKSPAFDKINLFTLSDLRLLLEVPGVTFVDVQYGDTSQERQAFAEETGVHILHDDDVDQLVDMDTFAAQLTALDLVIGIDNSLPQISAALGVPTWDFLRTVPFWSWGLEREDSFWFSAIRLFRQQKRGEWDSVIKRAAQELADYKFSEA